MDTEHAVSYFGDNTEAWVSERYIKPVTEERLEELKGWLTPQGQDQIIFSGELREQFLRAVAAFMFVLLRGWLTPSPHLKFSQ